MASIPANIAKRQIPAFDAQIYERLAETAYSLAKYDAKQEVRGYNLPALMLRSESSSSSQIERLTSSVKNIALAELSDAVPTNAKFISQNTSAMRRALDMSKSALSAGSIIEMHSILMADAQERAFRREQVWIGGTPYSPHDAAYVAPHHSRVDALMADWIDFAKRSDVNPVVKSAIAHAQFETIHPFTDGNGRSGRALLHVLFSEEGLLSHATLPISAGLLHDVDSYMSAISAYQTGDIEPIVERIIDALDMAVIIGERTAAQVDAVLDGWEETISERKASAIHRLPEVLVEQPVVNIAYLARALGITERAASSLVERACEYGILKKMGNAKRGAFFQAADLIDILEEASSAEGIRRMLNV
jgi:Fic family protein